MTVPRLWTEAEIQTFLGQEETLRLEFKAGRLLDKPESAWTADLSKEVSAFANTEGGLLVLGVPEQKVGKLRVASEPDGVAETITREQLQRKIEGNVFPYLSGIRVSRVPLSSPPGRVVFVLEIPPGSTAYQANDGRYYGRSEFEAKHLPDHEIRVRMARGKVARALLFFRLGSISLSADRLAELRKTSSAALEAFAADAESAIGRYPETFLDLMSAKFAPDEIRFDLSIRNDGELTIRDPSVELAQSGSSDAFGNLGGDRSVARIDMTGEILYPGDERLIPNSTRTFRCKPGEPIAVGDFIIVWKVFLDNALPSMGRLDLGEFLQSARDRSIGQSARG